ncbi:hypothetical protein Ahy_A02g009402 [Arachis hypogaea]|uniref:Aminotransferase-like plant mobile domain-containing protein n=1 Tax=Arachis hypogaea TaxID=3818 RepID=A0A445EGW7_ARAHY|nr:hypothetical protein Ahy_A02g009402 [Arachis hypogaea]
MGDDPGRLYRLDGVTHIAGVINEEKFAVNCTWFQETFGECPAGADEETMRRFARAYIMMLLGTQLFADKSGNRIHIRWLPYVARLEEMAGPLQLLQSWIFWHFPRFRPAGYDTCSWTLASRWSGYNPPGGENGPRVQNWRLRLAMLQATDFIWMPYSSPEVLQVVHPEVLEPRHTAMWRFVTSLIYFAVIEWHQIDRVLPQFGGVQPRPQPALNIDFLMSKDGRGGDRWFSSALQLWHLHWESRADHVLRFDVVADPRPSHDFLQWWSQHGKRFLSPEMYLGDPRAIPIPVEASQRGAGRVPDMDRVDDVPDRRRVERRARAGTHQSQREWRWLDHAMDEGDGDGRPGGRRRGHGGRRRGSAAADDHGHHGHDDDVDQHGPMGGDVGGHAAVRGVSPHHVGHGGECYGSGMGDGTDQGDGGLGSGPLSYYFVGVAANDQTLQESTPWEDDAARRRGQSSGTPVPLAVDLNEPPTMPAAVPFALGGTPPSAYTTASHLGAWPSGASVQLRPPA